MSMEKIGVNNNNNNNNNNNGRLCILGLYVSCFAALLVQCDARNTKPAREIIHLLKKFDIDMDMPLDSSNSDVPYVFSMAPYDSLPPIYLPENAPPYCVYPPFTPQPTPSTNIPTPLMDYTPPPPPPEPILPGPTPPIPFPPSTPTIIPSPPPAGINVPNIPPIQPVLSPPYNYEPSPPDHNINIPPSPRTFFPPIFYPPPTVPPPPPHRAQATDMWCVAKASVPDPIIQEAMNYACGSGADCDQIQPSGLCFQPNTLFAHASYAFNSYWQRTKGTGGTCDFGGTAVLVTVDPSYDGCHFVYF